MSQEPLAAVIIPTYNRMGLLRRTFDCLTRQDIGPDKFEVLVVDDGSSDATAEVVRQYQEQLNLSYFFQEDQGFRVATARNVGIANARARVCAFIDSGMLPASYWLRTHLHSHATDDPVAVVGYAYCFNDGNEDAAEMRATLNLDDPDGTIARLRGEGKWLDSRENFYATHGDLASLPAPWLMYWTCNVSARTDQLRAVGGFDEAFRSWGGEDIELGYRLHLDGARFLLNRDASAVHYPHEKNHDEHRRTEIENYQYIARKHETPVTRLLATFPKISFFAINDIILEKGLPADVGHQAL
jgi:glycosyltransferase involved in cell wall biosynthesis